MITDSLPLRSKGVTVGSSFSGSIFWLVNSASTSYSKTKSSICIHSALYKFTVSHADKQY